jgi:hypothetical protein
VNLIGPIILTIVLIPVGSRAQQAVVEVPIRVVLPLNIGAGSCRFQYLLVGPFGGYGGSIRPIDGISDYEIETVHEGAAVESLKAFVACPGYQVETIVFNSLPPPDARTVVVPFEPLPTVPLAGLIRGWSTQENLGYVDVDYTPVWICQFFKLADCLLGSWKLARVPINSDGSFSANLPNFWGDPVIRLFNPQTSLGELTFRIRDQTTGNPMFTLNAAESAPPRGSFPVQARYPSEQMFDLDPSR